MEVCGVQDLEKYKSASLVISDEKSKDDWNLRGASQQYLVRSNQKIGFVPLLKYKINIIYNKISLFHFCLVLVLCLS